MEVSLKRGEIYPPWAPGALQKEEHDSWMAAEGRADDLRPDQRNWRISVLAVLQSLPAVRLCCGGEMDDVGSCHLQ